MSSAAQWVQTHLRYSQSEINPHQWTIGILVIYSVSYNLSKFCILYCLVLLNNILFKACLSQMNMFRKVGRKEMFYLTTHRCRLSVNHISTCRLTPAQTTVGANGILIKRNTDQTVCFCHYSIVHIQRSKQQSSLVMRERISWSQNEQTWDSVMRARISWSQNEQTWDSAN